MHCRESRENIGWQHSVFFVAILCTFLLQNTVFNELERELKKFNLSTVNFRNEIQILDDTFQLEVAYIENDVPIPIKEHLDNLESKIRILNQPKLNNLENFREANLELIETEKDILQIENELELKRTELNLERSALSSLNESLGLIENDIKNNIDALKLKNLGSIQDINTFKEICPVCYQKIVDSALISQNNLLSMSIEENINHLQSHKSLFEYSILQKNESISILIDNINSSEASLEKLRLLKKFIKNDVYSLNNTYSEQSVYQRVQYQKNLSELNLFNSKIDNYSKKFIDISTEWKKYLNDLEQLPKKNLSILDEKKLKSLRNFFVGNLGKFGYKSSYNLEDVYISNETYLPAIEMFDLKFDSSASDNIRAIWAYTIALLQTSNLYNGNHPGIIILDEPGQHSTIIDDVAALFNEVRNMPTTNQIIIGITMKDSDTKLLIKNEISAGCHEILITERAIKPIKKS